ncbi:MAG TPA: T9SS type A sorting domain-containing protein [Bacteroidetes bacterium]|nr:T9SS type A sorting domain-containing protein [Bacteroidota bacterium]HEX05251.1 T9SS type A sorting domain-containing protein [Bacteroidota bacterium]
MADSLMTDEYYIPLVSQLESLLEDAVMADDNKKYTLDDFRSELNDIPEKVAGRAEYMRNVIEEAPHPFTLLPARWDDENILLSWNSTATPDGSPITYTVEMASHYNFADLVSYEVGTDTSFILTDIPEMPLYWRPIAWGNDYYIRSMQHFEMIADTSEIPNLVVIDPDLFTAYPNPSSGAVRFRFDSEEGSDATLRITNVLGQLVYRTTVISNGTAGQSIVWTGRDQHDKPVASGMYFCTLERDYGRQTLRIVVIK